VMRAKGEANFQMPQSHCGVLERRQFQKAKNAQVFI
jgi:hypothetical protein